MYEALLKATPEYQKVAASFGSAGPAALFGLPPAGRALLYAALQKDLGRVLCIVTPGEAEATHFADDLKALGLTAAVFPPRDFMLRPVEGAGREYEYRRLSVLGALAGGRLQAVCVPAEALLQYTVPRAEFIQNTLTLKPGMVYNREALVARLFAAGYVRRSQVDGPGQFSVRGDIVDIYAPDMHQPARIEYWDDEIDSLASFDLLTQRRDGALEKIYLSPAREVLFGSTADTATVSWAIERGFERYALLTDLGYGRCTVSSLNDDDTTVTFTVVAATATGLQAAVEVSAVPRPLPAPAFTEEPRLAMGDSITLCYGIDLRGREDRSRITWYRCRDSRGSGAIPVAVGRGGKPLRSYRLTRADAGWHIMASIEPAHVRSRAGKAVRVVTDSPVDTGRTPEERCVETDFSTLPTAWQPMVAPGFWTVDGHKPSDTKAYQWAFDRNTDMWTYGSGFNGARGTGLLQAQRGARLLYTPAEPHGGRTGLRQCHRAIHGRIHKV